MIDIMHCDRREKLCSFLKTLRRRLDPHTAVLGEHERISTRRGRRVSQEEIAEATGVSRGWYVSLESGKPIRCSVSFLARVAAVLNATPPERAILFSLAIPELHMLSAPADFH
jgi:DNA-binding XRE family transcriptional regulator